MKDEVQRMIWQLKTYRIQDPKFSYEEKLLIQL